MEQIASYFRLQASQGRHLGPFRLLEDKEYENEAQFKNLVTETISTITSSPGRNLNLTAPSVFHAAIFLKAFQNQSVLASEPRQIPHLPGPLLFRGIHHAGYDIVSSYYRNSSKEEAGIRARAFARMMKELGDLIAETNIPLENYMAISQHYGCATNLIDFTPDPEIAAFFATNGGKENNTAVIYFATVNGLLNKNLKVILPPPFFERIILQRGVFLESESPLPKEWFHSISFPAFAEFPVFRKEGRCNVLPQIPWIDECINFINTHPVDELETALSLHDLYINSGKPAFNKYPSIVKETELAKWLDFYEDMRYWLACTMDAQTEYFNGTISAIERDNAALADMHAAFVRALGKRY